MDRLLRGVRKFQQEVFPIQEKLFRSLANGQTPDVMFITCADSRINPTTITQTEVGEVFILRNAGNIVPRYGGHIGGEAATIEYAVTVLGIRHIIVCGHSQCGAMTALLDPTATAKMPAASRWVHHADTARRAAQRIIDRAPKENLLDVLIQQNVLLQLQNLRTHPCITQKLHDHQMELHGWVYRIETGDMDIWTESTKTFKRLSSDFDGTTT